MTALLKKNIFKGGFKIYYQVKNNNNNKTHMTEIEKVTKSLETTNNSLGKEVWHIPLQNPKILKHMHADIPIEKPGIPADIF